MPAPTPTQIEELRSILAAAIAANRYDILDALTPEHVEWMKELHFHSPADAGLLQGFCRTRAHEAGWDEDRVREISFRAFKQ